MFPWRSGAESRLWAVILYVAALALTILTLRDLRNILGEYMRNPTFTSTRIVFNKSITAPNITFWLDYGIVAAQHSLITELDRIETREQLSTKEFLHAELVAISTLYSLTNDFYIKGHEDLLRRADIVHEVAEHVNVVAEFPKKLNITDSDFINIIGKKLLSYTLDITFQGYFAMFGGSHSDIVQLDFFISNFRYHIIEIQPLIPDPKWVNLTVAGPYLFFNISERVPAGVSKSTWFNVQTQVGPTYGLGYGGGDGFLVLYEDQMR